MADSPRHSRQPCARQGYSADGTALPQFSFLSRFVYFLLFFATLLLLYGFNSGELWFYYEMGGIKYSPFGEYVLITLLQMPAASFLPAALSLWIITLPLHWMFYGIDSAQERFAFLRSSALQARDITYGKVPHSIPAIIFLWIASISYIQSGCFSIHWPGVRYLPFNNVSVFWEHNSLLTIQENAILIIVCLIFAVMACFVSTFIITLGSRNFVGYALLTVFWVLSTGISIYFIGYEIGFLFNWEVNVLSAITQATLPISVLDFTRDYCINNDTIQRMFTADSMGFPLQLTYLAVVLTIQLLLSALAIYGVNWNVKRRLAGWPGPKELAIAAKAEEKRAQSI